MKNRSILARIAAKGGKKKNKKKTPVTQKIISRDPETNEEMDVFSDFNAAKEAGFNTPNIKGAITNGKKYKGRLWEYSK